MGQRVKGMLDSQIVRSSPPSDPLLVLRTRTRTGHTCPQPKTEVAVLSEAQVLYKHLKPKYLDNS